MATVKATVFTTKSLRGLNHNCQFVDNIPTYECSLAFSIAFFFTYHHRWAIDVYLDTYALRAQWKKLPQFKISNYSCSRSRVFPQIVLTLKYRLLVEFSGGDFLPPHAQLILMLNWCTGCCYSGPRSSVTRRPKIRVPMVGRYCGAFLSKT